MNGVKSSKLKIFVSAYACEPNLGSEIGVGWHWVLEMSKYYELWVLTRLSNKQSIENWFKINSYTNDIHFIYYDLPPILKFWKKGMRGVRIYYVLWQYFTNRIVKRTMQENDIKIYHLLTYGNALWPASRYGQKQFFIWGPTGGLDTVLNDYSRHYNLKGKFIEFFRRLVVNTLTLNYSFNKRCKNANLILCKTGFTRDRIPQKYRDKSIIFTDVAVDHDICKPDSEFRDEKVTKYLTVGKLDAWRGFDLIIEAIDLAVNENENIDLTIVGSGQDWDRLKKIVLDKGLSNYVKMVGKVSMKEYYQYMSETDVVINAALKEGAVTTSFDAMTLGKPLICIDTKGYTRNFKNDYSIIIPQQSRKITIDSLKVAILKLTDRNIRIKLGKTAQKNSEKFSWENKGKEIYNIFEEWYLKRV